MKQLPFIGSPSPLVELFCHVSIGVVIEQLIDESEDFLGRAASLANGQRHGVDRPTFESDLSRNHLIFAQGHILKQEAYHPFAIPITCPFIMPDSWEIVDEITNGLMLKGTQATLLLFPLLLNFLLNLAVLLQACIPLGLQDGGHQAVLWINAQKAALGQFCRIACPFDLLVSQALSSFGLCMEFFIHL